MVKGRKEKRAIFKVWGFIARLTGVLVSLAVGFGMISGTLAIPFISDLFGGIILIIAGWVVVVLSLLGMILAIIDSFTGR